MARLCIEIWLSKCMCWIQSKVLVPLIGSLTGVKEGLYRGSRVTVGSRMIGVLTTRGTRIESNAHKEDNVKWHVEKAPTSKPQEHVACLCCCANTRNTQRSEFYFCLQEGASEKLVWRPGHLYCRMKVEENLVWWLGTRWGRGLSRWALNFVTSRADARRDAMRMGLPSPLSLHVTVWLWFALLLPDPHFSLHS